MKKQHEPYIYGQDKSQKKCNVLKFTFLKMIAGILSIHNSTLMDKKEKEMSFWAQSGKTSICKEKRSCLKLHVLTNLAQYAA